MTFSNRLKATMAVLLVSFSLFLTFVAWSYRGKIEFDKSLIYLMDTVLDSHYKVVSAKLNKDEIDKDGYWLLNVNNNFEEELDGSEQFGFTDEADLKYYSQVFKQQFPSQENTDGFKLYRAEVMLGKGSICEKYSCNVTILAKRGSTQAIVSISKP